MLLQSSLGWVAGLTTLSCLLDPILAADMAAWKTRSVYQTMTDRFSRPDGSVTAPCNTTAGLYCGGTWQGTIKELDYIQGMGFDAIMISPIVKNIGGRVSYGEAYHGYWPLDLYSLNDHFGTEQDLHDLVSEVHARGMFVLMDTVINNMAYMTHGQNPADHIDYSVFTPFNNQDFFHPYCKITDWNNYTDAQLCQTGDNQVALPDLYTEHEDVQKLLEDWATGVIKKFNIDGLRIDAVKSVTPSFVRKFGDTVGGFMTGEEYERNSTIICQWQHDYIRSMPNYPMYFSMLDAFTQGKVASLANQIEEMKSLCSDVTEMVSFSENHDVARIGGLTSDLAIAKTILTFTLLFDGIPMVYQGQEQHLKGISTPLNREAIWLTKFNTQAPLYQLTKVLNTIRRHALTLDPNYVNIPSYPIYRGGSEIAISKGVQGRQVVTVLTNQGEQGGAYTLRLPASFNAMTGVTEIITCTNYTVSFEGELVVNMNKGEPRVFFPTQLMPGTGLCGFSDKNVSYTELKTGHKSTTISSGSSLRTGFLRDSSSTSAVLGAVMLGVMALVNL
ncbi:Alpha-amylase [Penicillium ucsense]|uniref:alpha-amylase n=1 Tax=Penicillium ucsense TaxID=2839758 RepID=A0A8J8W156_9EURO|nr:Alpha-amylase [Penicillium ucsense]KAF7733160.1 Alpha-amylase [Penicillium ucsense]